MRRGAGSVLLFAGRLVLSIVLVGGSIVGLAAGWRWITTTPRLAVRDVRIQGNARAGLEELALLTGIRPGANTLLLDTAAARAALEAHPWVRRAHVTRRLPDAVEVQVEEREPVATVALDALHLVDVHGEVFKRAQPGDPLDLPVVTGVAAADGAEAVREQVQEALDFLELWRARGLDEVAVLSEVHVDVLRGVSVTAVPKGDGARPTVAHLGTESHALRLGRLGRLWKLFAERGEHAREVFLDNRTRPQWVVARVE